MLGLLVSAQHFVSFENSGERAHNVCRNGIKAQQALHVNASK